MSEKSMRKRLIKELKAIDAISVENRVGIGTPDINYVEGWIELKWLKRWPKNAEESSVLISHYTPQQRHWLRKRAKSGGRVFLLLQVGKEWLLFKGEIAAQHVGGVNRPQLIQLAYAYWANGLNKEELIKCLK